MFGCTSKNLGKFLREYVWNLQLSYENTKRDRIYLFKHWQLMGPMNYNKACY
jgi:hypothetical protein